MEELPERIGWHLPRWLPSGFGLQETFLTLGSKKGGARWTDGRCRSVEVRLSTYQGDKLEGQRIGEWWLLYDAPGEGFVPEFGEARLMGYAAEVEEGRVYVHMLGVDRAEGDRIVLSIPT